MCRQQAKVRRISERDGKGVYWDEGDKRRAGIPLRCPLSKKHVSGNLTHIISKFFTPLLPKTAQLDGQEVFQIPNQNLYSNLLPVCLDCHVCLFCSPPALQLSSCLSILSDPIPWNQLSTHILKISLRWVLYTKRERQIKRERERARSLDLSKHWVLPQLNIYSHVYGG